MLVLLLLECSENNGPKRSIVLFSIAVSYCKNNVSSVRNGNAEMLLVQPTGNETYRITHQNVMFNCGLPVGFTAESEVRNCVIFYAEREKKSGNCKCTCPCGLSAGTGNLDEREYVLCLIKETNQLGTITLDYKNGMYEEILFPELKDYHTFKIENKV
jgi:hypothetical protein